MRFSFWKKIKSVNKERNNNLVLPERLITLLQFTPKDKRIFIEAFTHRTSQKKDTNGNRINYERLEFLGDAMLGAVIADYLYEKSPSQQEGYLTQMRSKIVSRKHLNEIGKNLQLTEFIYPKNNQKQSLGKNINGDLFEALIGAVYLEKGYHGCHDFIHRVVVNPYVDMDELENRVISYKSLMLEWSQKNKLKLTFNTFEEENAEDVTIFISIVRVEDKIVSKGRGTSKKKAEENAAKRTYYAYQNQINHD